MIFLLSLSFPIIWPDLICCWKKEKLINSSNFVPKEAQNIGIIFSFKKYFHFKWANNDGLLSPITFNQLNKYGIILFDLLTVCHGCAHSTRVWQFLRSTDGWLQIEAWETFKRSDHPTSFRNKRFTSNFLSSFGKRRISRSWLFK